ncbi:restriction endonuclease subunit S [Kaistella polysaccharea]|uniref:restriction endonuclease subunit S n=1 Tax=Kaistella polysaccharea TaxID=2878534 RepID=UPI001CF5BE8C|nr:restriction endonuclease subunit S [Kaistella polysaccharea]
MKETKLSSVIDVISMGPFGSDIKVDNFISHGIPVLNGSNLTSHKLVENSFKYVSLEKANKLGKANAFRGDIVITHRGTLGQVAYIPYNSKYERYIISQSQFRVRFTADLDPVYFSYLMKSDYGQKKLMSFKSHVGVPALAQATSNFKRLELRLHDIINQKQIAAVLSALDDKIELNNKINIELEQMAKTLYDYWFVQFDFPVASTSSATTDTELVEVTDKHAKGYKSSGGEMVYNAVLKREIPKGWEVKRLSEIANITMGQSPAGTSYNQDKQGMMFFQGSTDFEWRFPTVRMYTTAPTRFALEGDILLSVRAPIGTMNVASTNCCIGRGLAALNSRDGYNSYLIYQMNYFKKKFDYLNSVGTTFGSLTKDDLYNLELVYPSKEILINFEKIVSTFDKKIKINSLQNQELASLRDWLLPMLMNGQVRVGESDGEGLGLVAESQSYYNK